ncbi:MAG: hypothetical protein HQM01_08085 [Magnetococcales bacterium]|nr:hypothetical protein [Magnetococcales bacterium]
MKDLSILLIDVANFSRYDNVQAQRRVLEALQRIFTKAARFFMPYGDVWSKWVRHGTGDGYYIALDNLPPQVALCYASKLEGGLKKHNQKFGQDLPLRMRMVLAFGDLEKVGDQWLSEAFIEAERIINYDRFKKHLNQDKTTVLAATSAFHYQWMKDNRPEDPTLKIQNAQPWRSFAFKDKQEQVREAYLWGELWDEPVETQTATSPVRQFFASGHYDKREPLGMPAPSQTPMASILEGQQTPECTEQLVSALFGEAVEFGNSDQRQLEMALYDHLIRKYHDRSEPTIAGWVAKAMFNKAVRLGISIDPQAELAQYDSLFEHYQDRPEAGIAEHVAKAMVNKAVVLGQRDDPEGELALYDALIARYQERPEAELAEQVASAMFNKAVVLGQRDDLEGALALYDALIARYQERPEAELAEPVASAMFNKAIVLGQRNESEEEMELYDQVIARYQDRPDVGLAEQVVNSKLKKAIHLRHRDEHEAATAFCDQVIARYQDRSETVLVEKVAMAMLYKAVILLLQDQPKAGLALCDQVITRYQDHPEAELAEWVARAHEGKIYIMDLLHLRFN